VRCYNEAREIVIVKYLETKKVLMNSMREAEDEKQIDFDQLKILEMLKLDEELISKGKDDFVIKASSLLDAWKKD